MLTAHVENRAWRSHGVRLSGLYVLVFACALAVHWPHLALDFAFDDRYMAREIGLVETARKPLAQFALEPVSEHFVPFWKLGYYARWRVLGLQPAPWRLLACLWQAASATLLFVLLREYGASMFAAIVAAVWWSAVALGQWDEPLLYIWNHNYLGALFWLMAGMWAIAARPRLAPWILMATMLLAVLTWSIVWAMLPALAAQIGFDARTGRLSRSQSARLFVAWTCAWLTLGAVVGVIALAGKTGVGTFSIVAITRPPLQFAVALGNMLWWIDLEPGDVNLAAKCVLAVGTFLIAIGLAQRESRPIVIVLWLLAWLYLVLVSLGRGDYPLRAALSSGRYLYMAALPWCAAIGVGLGELANRIAVKHPRGWLAMVFLVALLCALEVAHQRQVAQRAAELYRLAFRADSRSHRQQSELIAKLAEHGGSEARLLLPDLPIWLPLFPKFYHPASGFAAVVDPNVASRLRWARGDELDHVDLAKVDAALASVDHPLAGVWRNLLPLATDDFRLILWIDRFAAKDSPPWALPDFQIKHGSLVVSAAELARWGYRRPLENIVFRSAPEPDRKHVAWQIERLSANGAPEAARWVGILKQLSAE
jgi:hypothetical protein